MWRLKQFMPKEQAGLEGKSVEVGSFKLQVRSVIAQGGFSCVYLAKDAQTGKNYALKHIICNDGESLDLVRKEVAVMKALRGHPNIVTLHAQTVFDNGRTKECFLLMDYCDKTLVNVLDNRGAGYFEEKQLLLIFRDICNAVYGMHCQSPPIAHRDLKAENVLIGSDGLWKLCDFGSTSTNHRIFEKAEDMGLEEDIIRKHTTPAYRAPEMWDLYRRELISEKVDIWALGCLLYRMAFLKSAFDGESKLQILNGNYRIPPEPRYSDVVVQLIKDMLTASPEARPDIMQVWRRVNEALPSDYRKACPDRTSTPASHDIADSKPAPKNVVPSRSPPPPPSSQSGGSVGSFWSTQFAANAIYDDDKDSCRSSSASSGWSAQFTGTDAAHPPQRNKSPVQAIAADPQLKNRSPVQASPPDLPQRNKSPIHANAADASQRNRGGVQATLETSPGNAPRRSGAGNFVKRVQGWSKEENGDGYYAMMSELEKGLQSEQQRNAPVNSTAKVLESSGDGTSSAEFDSKLAVGGSTLPAEMEKLKLQLKQALAEKSEFAGKYEKLTAICRSQRQEIQELKAALAAPNANKDSAPKPPPAAQSKRTLNWHSTSDQSKDKQNQNGTIWDLQSGLTTAAGTQTTDSSMWQAFGESSKVASKPSSSSPGGNDFPISGNSVRRQQHTRAASMSAGDTWATLNQHSSGNNNQQESRLSTSSRLDSSAAAGGKAPAGWAGF